MACFFCPLASDIIKITLNTNYFPSISCVTLMIFYPIFQSTIQLQSTLIYSILDIKNFVMIICLTSLLGLPVHYYLYQIIK